MTALSVGDGTSFAPEAMLVAAQRWRRCELELDAARSALAVALGVAGQSDQPTAHLSAGLDLVAPLVGEAAALAIAVDTSVSAYESAEGMARSAAELAGERLGLLIGGALPALAVSALPALLGIGAAALLAQLLVPEEQIADLTALAAPVVPLLTDPAFVLAVRTAASSLDDVAVGAAMSLGLAPALAAIAPIVQLLGPRAGLSPALVRLFGGGAEGSAVGVALGAGALGLVRETPVRARAVYAGPAEGPVALGEVLERVPRADEGDVRVEVYTMPDGSERAVLYAGPTNVGEAAAAGEVNDMTSNVGLVAGLDAGSLRAAEAALAAAGVGAETPLMVAGYSQGAVVAARLAESGDWNVQRGIAVGGPLGTVDVPPGTFLSVEHENDVVTAAGGFVRGDVLTVTATPGDIDRSDPLGAHHRALYAETVAAVDASEEQSIRAFADEVRAFTSGAVAGRSETYVTERLAEGVTVPAGAVSASGR